MGEYDSGPRKLSWDLSFPLATHRTTEDDGEDCEPSSFVWPADSDERVLVPFYLSLNEYNVLASAIDVGSDIAYGEDALRVTWLWLRNMRCKVPICDLIADALLNCEEVQTALATLIATNPTVKGALRGFVTGDSVINQHIQDIANTAVLTAAERGMNLLKPDACDYGYTFNQASTFVFLLNQLTEDLFEAIEVGTNSLERAEKLVSAIPGVGGLLPFDEIIGIADALVANVSEDYAGAYDQGLYDDLRCGLWCTFKDTCGLNIDEALAFYQDKLGETLPQNPIDTLAAIFQFLAAGDIPGDTPVYAMHLLVIAAMRAGQEMFGINFAQLGIRIVAAGDETDNDYLTLCDECAPPPTERTPVIATIWDAANGARGSITGPDSNGFYTATSEAGPFDEAIHLMDVDERDFKLTDISFSAGPFCEVYHLDGVTIRIDCDGVFEYVGETIDELVVTWSLGASQTMTFKMVAP